MEKFLTQLGGHFWKVIERIGDIGSGIREFIVFVILAIMAFSNIQLMLLVLAVFWVVDTVMAICIQRQVYRTTGTHPEVYTIESNKLRDAGIKLVAYGCIILVSTTIIKLFFGGSLVLIGTTESITGSELAVALCLFIEFWSILENLKKLGFDIIGRLQKASNQAWKTIRTLKGE